MSNSSDFGSYGFRLVRPNPGFNHVVARFFCTRCDATIDALVKSPLNPETPAKRAALKGWDADTYHPSVSRCPACKGKKTRGESPKETTMAPPLPKPTGPATPPQVATPLPRDPSAAERLKIRTLLDAHFDDMRGAYIDGYSDQRIGTEVDVPWAIVTRMREAGWGPILVNPEMEKVNEDPAALRAKIEATREVAAGALLQLNQLRDELSAVGDRVNVLYQRRAAP